jgi:hypothetical protein
VHQERIYDRLLTVAKSGLLDATLLQGTLWDTTRNTNLLFLVGTLKAEFQAKGNNLIRAYGTHSALWSSY